MSLSDEHPSLSCDMKFEQEENSNGILEVNKCNEMTFHPPVTTENIYIKTEVDENQSEFKFCSNKCENSVENIKKEPLEWVDSDSNCEKMKQDVEDHENDDNPPVSEFLSVKIEPEKSFAGNSGLEKNIAIPNGNSMLLCTLCKKLFSHKANLDRHMQSHYGIKPFVCHICEYSFTRKHHLERHMFQHGGTKPYKCTICEKSFVQKNTLQRHIDSHVGKKPYSCEHCGKSFIHKSHLNRHAEIHSAGKRFECNICGRTFYWKSNMERHIFTHGV